MAAATRARGARRLDRPPKLWGGRFTGSLSSSVEAFNASLPVDRRLYQEDILASVAHARMLARQGIIPLADARAIVAGLLRINEELTEQGGPTDDGPYEDIHSLVEARLYEIAGAAAGRLHTARSRNDQVATDLRLWARRALCECVASVLELQAALLARAEADREHIIPGYTHLQRAQPVLLAHHWLAYVEMLARDLARLEDCYARVDVLPLGSGALAGAPYPLDREYVAELLGFTGVSANSIDAVSDRDFVVEHLAAIALIAVHLSRLTEELVMWSSTEFGFIEVDEGYATGSSIMPQKRNPDVAELVRGKSGRAVGSLVALLVTLKGLPLAYNKDLQEDKEPYFVAVEEILACLRLTAEMLATLKVQRERLEAAVADPLLLATDLADDLTRRGMPFREAHAIVGAIVRDHGPGLAKLSPDQLRGYSPLFGDSPPRLSPRASVRARDLPGATAPRRVAAALRQARRAHVKASARLADRRAKLPSVETLAKLAW